MQVRQGQVLSHGGGKGIHIRAQAKGVKGVFQQHLPAYGPGKNLTAGIHGRHHGAAIGGSPVGVAPDRGVKTPFFEHLPHQSHRHGVGKLVVLLLQRGGVQVKDRSPGSLPGAALEDQLGPLPREVLAPLEGLSPLRSGRRPGPGAEAQVAAFAAPPPGAHIHQGSGALLKKPGQVRPRRAAEIAVREPVR